MFLHLSVKFHEFTFFWASPIMWNNDVISDVKIIARDQSMKENPQKIWGSCLRATQKIMTKVTEAVSCSGSVCV